MKLWKIWLNQFLQFGLESPPPKKLSGHIDISSGQFQCYVRIQEGLVKMTRGWREHGYLKPFECLKRYLSDFAFLYGEDWWDTDLKNEAADAGIAWLLDMVLGKL